MRRLLSAFALLAVATSSASAQVQVKQFAVVTRLGAVTPERASSLNTGGLIGLDTEYALSKYFGIGVNADVMRTTTHREDFLTRLVYGNAAVGGGDSVHYQYLGQPINVINIGAFATLRAPNDKFSPFVMGGVGTFTMIGDAQVNGKNTRLTDMSLMGGAGISIKLGDRVGIQLDARAIQMQGYDREFLNPASGKSQQITPFPEDFPVAPAAKNTSLNTTFTLGFRYLPGGIGGN